MMFFLSLSCFSHLKYNSYGAVALAVFVSESNNITYSAVKSIKLCMRVCVCPGGGDKEGLPAGRGRV